MGQETLGYAEEKSYRRATYEKSLVSVSSSSVETKKNPKNKSPEEKAKANKDWRKLMRLPRKLKEPSLTGSPHHERPKCRH
jgi:hypothetical protein